MKVNYEQLMPDLMKILNQDIGHPEGNMSSFPDVIEQETKRKVQKGAEIPGWEAFNKATDGLRSHEFSILCGPTGAGKTTILANLYANFMAQGVPVFAAPVEVGAGSFARKVVSIISGKHPNAINADWPEINKKFGPLFFSNEGMLLSTYSSRVNHLYLLCDILHAYRTRGTRITLIDNLNYMMEPSEKENQMIQYDRVIHDWVVFHKKIPIHSIMVMHPRKTENMRVDSEGDIKGSSTAIQESQNVFLFNRLKDQSSSPEGADPYWCREIKIAKCRENGRFWGQTILFSLDKVSEKYEERGFL